jgi:hypothetical protein
VHDALYLKNSNKLKQEIIKAMKAHRFAGIINDPTVKDGTTKIFDRSVGNKDFQLYLYNMPESLG